MGYGIAAESLVNGVHLKLKPNEFLKEWAIKSETPSFEDSKKVLIADLSNKISNDYMGVLSVILDIIWTKRNNLAHFAYQQGRFSHHPPLIWEIFVEVIEHYIEFLPREIEQLREHIDCDREKYNYSDEFRFQIESSH